jgi:hypothetical protein
MSNSQADLSKGKCLPGYQFVHRNSEGLYKAMVRYVGVLSFLQMDAIKQQLGVS